MEKISSDNVDIIQPNFNFQSPLENISFHNPLVCKISKILQFNYEQEFLSVLLLDNQANQMLGFIYGENAIQLYNHQESIQFPISITIFKGTKKKLTEVKNYLEIFHLIIDLDFLINSNWIGGYEFCSMQTYLNAYLNIETSLNENQLWGNLLHDYLSIIFSTTDLISNYKNQKYLTYSIRSSFLLALYRNWALIVANEKDFVDLVNIFENEFFTTEFNFITTHLANLEKEFVDFSIICEKMIYSKYFGLQGRLDRYILDKQNSIVKIIETKTGQSPRSSQVVAYYQSLAYANILKESLPLKIDEILIEYPRLPVERRFISYEFDYTELLKVFRIRNEIYFILHGFIPSRQNNYDCTRCSLKDACDFYIFKKNCKSPEIKDISSNKFQSLYNQSQKIKTTFQKISIYYDWFMWLLEKEYRKIHLQNIRIKIPIEIQEEKGNAIGSLQCSPTMLINNKNSKLLRLIRNAKVPILNIRLRSGDYVIITPEDQRIGLIEHEYGILRKIEPFEVEVELFKPVSALGSFFTSSQIRIDMSSSTYLVNLQKRAMDKFTRFSLNSNYLNITKLRDILFFDIKLSEGDDFNKYGNIGNKNTFDISQIQAIKSSINCKEFHLIQGPPGTGKTTLIVEIISQLIIIYKQKLLIQKQNLKKPTNLEKYVQNPKRFVNICPILLSTFTNSALDHIILKLLNLFPDIKLIRLGDCSNIENPDILSHSLEHLCKENIEFPNGSHSFQIDPLKAKLLLKNAEIIASSVLYSGNVILSNFQFETVILDEAGQITEPAALIPLLKGDRFIMIGDHMQLAPISQSLKIPDSSFQEKDLSDFNFSKEKGLDQSIFERLVSHYQNSISYSMLKFQYRMNDIISRFISQVFYNNELESGQINQVSIGSQDLTQLFTRFQINPNFEVLDEIRQNCFNPKLPMIFLDTKKINAFDSTSEIETKELESKFNETEADIVTRIILDFVLLISKNIGQREKLFKIMNCIGIISGFRAQNTLIQKKLIQTLNSAEKLQKLISINPSDFSENFFNHLTIDTVDRYQGQERDLIIYSFVDSNKNSYLHELNLEMRRLNVAISRAKKKIIFIGNSTTLTNLIQDDNESSKRAKKIYSTLIGYVKKHKGYFVLEDLN